MRRYIPLLGAAALTACGSGNSTSEQLENAAAQSDPAAAAVLENAAEQAEGSNMAAAQDALQDAGNAQAATVDQGTAAPPAEGALPHKEGDPVPPPKTGE